MLALCYNNNGKVTLETALPKPRVDPGWALIRVTCAGFCTTDLELTRGYKDFQGVLGHEFCGIVESAPGARTWEGRRVVGEINIACGSCAVCRRGDRTHCERRRVLGILNHDGAFAEYLTLPIENLLVVPDTVPDEVAVFTEPVAAALEILEQVHVRPNSTAYVLGDGKLGLLVAQVLGLAGTNCRLLGRHAEKLALAETWGLQTSLVEKDGSVANAGLPPADLVVDCTGHPTGQRDALALLRPRGTLVLKSTFHGDEHWNPTEFAVNEWTLVGSRCGPFAPALRLLARGLIKTSPLISATYPLAEAVQAFQHASRPGVLKVLLRAEG